MVIKSLIFPFCWVCQRRFNNQVPPGPALEERHHLFPQAAGGVDGPVVSLCDSDHTRAHKIAYAMKGNRSFMHLLAGCTKEQAQKLVWIATLIVKAEALAANDPNKPVKVRLILNRTRQAQMQWLQKRLNAKSMAAVYDAAFDALYSYHRRQS